MEADAKQVYIERFAGACIQEARELESLANNLRALASKVTTPPEGTYVELTNDPYTVRFVTPVKP